MGKDKIIIIAIVCLYLLSLFMFFKAGETSGSGSYIGCEGYCIQDDQVPVCYNEQTEQIVINDLTIDGRVTYGS